MKIIRSVFTFLILFLFAQVSFAQYQIGVRGGKTTAWQNYGETETPEDAEIDIRGNYGSLFLYKKLGNRTSLGIEPAYTIKGARCVPGFNDPFVGDTRFILRYLEAPVFIKYSLPIVAEKLSVYGKTGYGMAYLLRAKEGVELSREIGPIQYTDIPLGNPFEKDGQFKRFEHSLYGGMGVSYTFNRNSIHLEGNYTFGLSNVDRNFDSSNRVISWGVGYSYNFM